MLSSEADKNNNPGNQHVGACWNFDLLIGLKICEYIEKLGISGLWLEIWTLGIFRHKVSRTRIEYGAFGT
jgi:hypothetical protein